MISTCDRVLQNQFARGSEPPLVLQGELTITSEMENLSNSLFLDSVPESWERRAYPSLYGLTQWYADLIQRCKELESWVSSTRVDSC